MVLALSNVLGLPIIVFSSAHHYPIINISPRVCKAAIPLYLAFNQCGAGHYDAVVLKTEVLPSKIKVLPSKSNSDTRCTCGKGSSTLQHCGVLKHKYTTSIRCPCHLSERGCIPLCKCSNCANPHGIKPKYTCKPSRERRKHAWNSLPSKSALYAQVQREKLTTGPRTQLEFLLVCQILSLLRRKEVDSDLHVTHKIYTTCVELCQSTAAVLPLSIKTPDELSNIIDEYNKNKKIFESTCIAQLKINHEQ